MSESRYPSETPAWSLGDQVLFKEEELVRAKDPAQPYVLVEL